MQSGQWSLTAAIIVLTVSRPQVLSVNRHKTLTANANEPLNANTLIATEYYTKRNANSFHKRPLHILVVAYGRFSCSKNTLGSHLVVMVKLMCLLGPKLICRRDHLSQQVYPWYRDSTGRSPMRNSPLGFGRWSYQLLSLKPQSSKTCC